MPQPAHSRPAAIALSLALMIILLSGCASPAAGRSLPTAAATFAPTTLTATISPTATPAATSGPLRISLSPNLPDRFLEQLELPSSITIVEDSAPHQISLSVVSSKTRAEIKSARWIYVLAAAFPTVTDDVRLDDLLAAWRGESRQHLLVTANTRAVFEQLWGPAGRGSVQTLDQTALLDAAWKDPTAWAILPFEEVGPRWKVLRVDGQTPMQRAFDGEKYPLAVRIALNENTQSSASHAEVQVFSDAFDLPTNDDPGKLTVLAMTGTTAISRHIGERMEAKGMTYPDQDIRPYLANADLTHISNEVSFYTACPKPGPERADMRFCSSPKYIQLLEDAGTDIVELTGNHILDWGFQPFLDTLAMYQQRGWKTYGGGASLADAQKPLLIEHNGNKLAFIGCSPAGPEGVWATADKPGSAPCNFDKLEKQIRGLHADGYLPIVTFQAVETDTYKPATAQGMPNFRRMAAAGAVIVSGSQSHVPQTMTFVGDSFVHYGLGNLFFDQMNPIETRQEFIDQHVFYNGKYLGVQLVTALLEDYARPRPMTAAERETFLQKIFSLSDWNGKYP